MGVTFLHFTIVSCSRLCKAKEVVSLTNNINLVTNYPPPNNVLINIHTYGILNEVSPRRLF